VTASNLGHIRKWSRSDVIPVRFGENNVQSPHEDPSLQWFHSDWLIYQGFDLSPKSRRYVYFEWDTYCNMDIRMFFEGNWGDDLACVQIVRSDAEPEWGWFKELKRDGFDLIGAFGVRPLSAVMFSRGALESICRRWREPRYAKLFCEARVGQLARDSGIVPQLIKCDLGKISHFPVDPSGPGIWHSVKKMI
jgi:hypothetical protein